MDARLLRIANRFLFVIALLPALPPAHGQQPQRITIDPRTPLAELLPPRPSAPLQSPVWLDGDLAQVAELTFSEPISAKSNARQQTAHTMAKISHLNSKNRDGFMEALIANRADLRGLPFRMGDECRTEAAQASIWRTVAPEVRDAVAAATWTEKGIRTAHKLEYVWWESTQTNRRGQLIAKPDQYDRALVGAMMQVLGPEPAPFRIGLARYLSEFPGAEATRALANLAIFSPEEEVRSAAINGLKKRSAKDCTDILLRGLQYPLPAAAQRSAQALIKLERKDLIADLINVLDQTDPRLPVKKTVNSAEVFVVREVVRVNHNRNCLLCHSPGDTPDVPEGVIQAPVPVPGESLQPPVQYYRSAPPSPNIFVRIDTTYLRQDFSMMMPVENAKPWPDRQRFDFLVRSRELTATQAAEYQEQAARRTKGQLSPYHRAAALALRELTGRDAGTTARAWRQALKI